MKKIYWLILLIGTIGHQCTEPYEHEVKDFEHMLVVQGMITDEPGPYQVKLNRTIPLAEEHPEEYFETGAVVTISDNQGNFETLTEKNPGIYETDPNGLQGTIGHEYILTIRTRDGMTYESEPVTLREGPGIDSIYPGAQKFYSTQRNKMIQGIDILIDTEDWEKGEDQYFRWDLEETWELKPIWRQWSYDTLQYLFRTGLYRNDQPENSGGSSRTGHSSQMAEEDTSNCWHTNSSSRIIIQSSEGLNTNQLKGHPIFQLDEYSYKPFYGYSLMVKQYTVNKPVYDFWRMLRENTQANGTVFDNIPYNAQGNIYACENENTRVFGYFDACSVTRQRVHYKSPVEGVEFYDRMANCVEDTVAWGDFFGDFPSQDVFVVRYDNEYLYYTNQDWCVTCRENATYLTEPDFWIY